MNALEQELADVKKKIAGTEEDLKKAKSDGDREYLMICLRKIDGNLG
jgi:hypothetical protein